MKRKTIGIDFDRVIYRCSRGLQEGNCFDPPTPGSLGFLKAITQEFGVFIFTTRAPEQVQNYLHQHAPDIPTCILPKEHEMAWNALGAVAITNRRLAFDVYIDDQALRLNGDWQRTLKAVQQICSRNEGIEVTPRPPRVTGNQGNLNFSNSPRELLSLELDNHPQTMNYIIKSGRDLSEDEEKSIRLGFSSGDRRRHLAYKSLNREFLIGHRFYFRRDGTFLGIFTPETCELPRQGYSVLRHSTRSPRPHPRLNVRN